MLLKEFETPKVRRSREHIAEILKLNPESAETELLLAKTIESTLKELKRLYDAAIKPLEILYKYRDLSNRHFGGQTSHVIVFTFYAFEITICYPSTAQSTLRKRFI